MVKFASVVWSAIRSLGLGFAAAGRMIANAFMASVRVVRDAAVILWRSSGRSSPHRVRRWNPRPLASYRRSGVFYWEEAHLPDPYPTIMASTCLGLFIRDLYRANPSRARA